MFFSLCQDWPQDWIFLTECLTFSLLPLSLGKEDTVPPAYSLAVLGTKNTHWWCHLCFKQNKMSRTEAVEISHYNISIYFTNVESNYDLKKKIRLDAGKHHARHGKWGRSEPQWLEQCLGVHTYPLTQYPAFSHACWLLSIVLSALPLLLLILIVNPAKWVTLHLFPFTDENTEAQIGFISHGRNDACLHQDVFFILKLDSTFVK